MTRVIFMGTPEFAVPSLAGLIAAKDQYDVVAVVTQPDAPAGRGKQLAQSAVKQWALAHDLIVLQPPSLKPPDVVEQLRALQPDVIVVAAFGQILRRNVLEMPPHGCVNVHGSLLPRWRGASPVSAAIAAGDAVSGITIMKMDVGLDSGPMLSKRETAILADDTSGSLMTRLAQIGADLLIETLPGYLSGAIAPQVQDEALVTLCRQIKKEEGQIDWQRSAIDIERHVRAMSPWPSAFTHIQGKLLKIWKSKVATMAMAANEAASDAADTGRIHVRKNEVLVQCGQGALQLLEVQPEGKKPMSAADFARGAMGLDGIVCG